MWKRVSTKAGQGGEGNFNDPAEGRYVDKAFNPLPAEILRSAAESENPDEAYLAVAKRMPVRMRVRIDQRALNRFLIECGNSDLMLEVKQVRINPPDGSRPSARGGRGGPRGGMFRGGEGVGGSESGAGEYPWDITAEVYGVIYIFNPPSLKRLDLTEEQIAKYSPVNGPATRAAPVAAPGRGAAGR